MKHDYTKELADVVSEYFSKETRKDILRKSVREHRRNGKYMLAKMNLRNCYKIKAEMELLLIKMRKISKKITK